MASIDPPEVRELDARYIDTADMHLAREGYALRRRTGGPDEGWHIKGPMVGGGRTEQHWPIGDDHPDAIVVPDTVQAEVDRLTDAPLAPLAWIRNHRTAYALRSADGGLVAEFVDDHVSATDMRTGVERSWREWEFELGPAAPADHQAFFAAVDAAVQARGGRNAASASKLSRTLGF